MPERTHRWSSARALRVGLVVASSVLVLASPASAGLAVSAYSATAFGPEGMAVEQGQLLAPPAVLSGARVAGVSCGPPETAYHIHVHLSVYVAGRLRPVPAAVGLVSPVARQTPTGPFYDAHQCYYSLHTHAQDGVVHVEGSEPRPYTLGQFFALWGQPLTEEQVGPAVGHVTVYVDGRQVDGAPAQVPLTDRSTIQLDVGARVPPAPVSWIHF